MLFVTLSTGVRPLQIIRAHDRNMKERCGVQYHAETGRHRIALASRLASRIVIDRYRSSSILHHGTSEDAEGSSGSENSSVKLLCVDAWGDN